MVGWGVRRSSGAIVVVLVNRYHLIRGIFIVCLKIQVEVKEMLVVDFGRNKIGGKNRVIEIEINAA